MKVCINTSPFSPDKGQLIFNTLFLKKEEGCEILACPRINTTFKPSEYKFFTQIWENVESPTIAYCVGLVFIRIKISNDFNENKFFKDIFSLVLDNTSIIENFSLDIYPKEDNKYQVCINNIPFTLMFLKKENNLLSISFFIPHRTFSILEEENQINYQTLNVIAKRIKKLLD